jgi:RNA polymerase sigma factor
MQLEKTLEDSLLHIRNGDEHARSALITHYLPFILRTVNHVCKRRISWNDDEASIGLIAFNEALDRYKVESEKTFENFAFLIIRSRLIDEFRKKARIIQLEAQWQDEESETSVAQTASSLAAFEKHESNSALAEELAYYEERLQDFGIRLEELEESTPNHRDTRQRMVGIARMFCGKPEWLHDLFHKKQLPLKRMSKEVDVSKKTLERNRKYLISLILIFSCEDFARIRQAISFAGLEEGS